MRGNEWQDGVGRVASINRPSPDFQRYLHAVSPPEEIAAIGSRRYPGSPVLAVRAMRPGDRIVLVEKQITEAQTLEQSTRGRRGVSVVCGDGYAALKTYLPPRENRGLVLIDPPYESENEFTQVERALHLSMSRWPNGMFALWYPIKASRETQRLHAALQSSSLKKL